MGHGTSCCDSRRGRARWLVDAALGFIHGSVVHFKSLFRGLLDSWGM